MIAFLILIGLAAGIVSTVFGIGGGSIIIPAIFFYDPSTPPVVAVTCSLAVIFITCFSNLCIYLKHKEIIFDRSHLYLVLFAILGGLIGSQTIYYIDPEIFKQFFAVILFVSALRSLVKVKASSITVKEVSLLRLSSTSIIGSIFSAATGLGGGIIFLPLLGYWVKLPFDKLPIYSNLLMCAATLAGLISHLFADLDEFHFANLPNWWLGQLHLVLCFILLLGSLLGGKWGVKLAPTLSDLNKRILLGGLLIILSIKTMISTIK